MGGKAVLVRFECFDSWQVSGSKTIRHEWLTEPNPYRLPTQDLVPYLPETKEVAGCKRPVVRGEYEPKDEDKRERTEE